MALLPPEPSLRRHGSTKQAHSSIGARPHPQAPHLNATKHHHPFFTSTMIVPAAVQAAVAEFTETERFSLRPPRPNESSFIFKFGVRVMFKPLVGVEQLGWICLADQNCRENIAFTPLYSGRTSRATKHLKDAHNCTSDKYGAEVNRKRTREEELDDLRASLLITQDPKRMRILLETKRAVLNNLPFRFGESDEARILSDLCMKDEFKATVNSKTVGHAVVELYSSTKEEVVGLLREHDVAGAKFLTVVTDFWTCKTQHTKYLGVRVYFVGKDWKLYSILLGTRRFTPSYGDRDTGIRRPFRRWITQMLIDFGLSTANLFGGMSDAGPDVRWMLQSGLGLQWEWCLAHLSNAATKMACGLVNNKKDSKNPEMTALIDRVCKTVRQVRDVEVMGSLFEALCEMEGHGTATKLLDYKSHRFLGLTVVVRRILDRWAELEQWYAARAQKARREGKIPPPFLLEDDQQDLVQLLSLLQPITALNKKSQAEGCGQVEVLLTLYRLRLKTLNSATPLVDYRSTQAMPSHFATSELTALTIKNRSMLAATFDKNFFSRY